MMRLQVVRFTVRGLIIAVAVADTDLGGQDGDGRLGVVVHLATPR
jgi:hypothetical protein